MAKRYVLKDCNGEITVEVSRRWIRMWREDGGKIMNLIGFEPSILHQIKARYRDRIPKVRPT